MPAFPDSINETQANALIAAYAQPLDSDLTSIAALSTTSHGRSLLVDSDAAASRTKIGAFAAAGGTLGGDLTIPLNSSLKLNSITSGVVTLSTSNIDLIISTNQGGAAHFRLLPYLNDTYFDNNVSTGKHIFRSAGTERMNVGASGLALSVPFKPMLSTIASLPLAASNPNAIAVVSDSSPANLLAQVSNGAWRYVHDNSGVVGASSAFFTSSDIQAMFDKAVADGSEVVLPAGTFEGNWTITNANSIRIRGAGKTRTILMGTNPLLPTLKIEGLWYSRLQDFCIGRRTGTVAALDIDKSSSFGVQGNTFDNLYVNGQGTNDGVKSTYAVAMCRVGGSSAQGSEQMFINCHFEGASQACYYQNGFNALNNTILGGNFQNYTKNAIELLSGSIAIYSVAFQCANAGQSGWDIAIYNAGIQDSILIFGCRTESPYFCKASWSQPPTIIGCSQNTGYPIADDAYVVDIERGRVQDCKFQGPVRISFGNPNYPFEQLTTRTVPTVIESFELDKYTRYVLVDATIRPATITLNAKSDVPHEVTIIKGDSSSNPVKVVSAYMNNEVNEFNLTTANSQQKFVLIGGGTLPKRYYFDTNG